MVFSLLYYLSVVAVAALGLASVEGKIPRIPRVRYAIVFGYSLISEWPLVFIFFKIIFIVLASMLGVLKGWTSQLFYVIDLITMIGLFVIFLDGYEAKSAIQEAIQHYSKDAVLPSFTSETFWQRIVNPRFVPKNVIHYAGINYSITKEANEAREMGYDQPNYMCLDVYARKGLSDGPILLFIHGGGWKSGDKDTPYPLIRHLAETGWVVVSANYRLAPKVHYPAQLIDVKRALRWIRVNIHAFGGNPKFIAVAGDDAGGHLAAMVALTPNDPKYQPGFEDLDTRVEAVVLINAYTDLLWEPRFARYFSVKIAGLEDKNEEFLKEHSPINLIKENSVPFLVFHGNRDSLVPFETSKKFAETYKNIAKGEIHFIEIPGGNHVYHVFSSPRSHYQAIGVERWLNHLYQKKGIKEAAS